VQRSLLTHSLTHCATAAAAQGRAHDIFLLLLLLLPVGQGDRPGRELAKAERERQKEEARRQKELEKTRLAQVTAAGGGDCCQQLSPEGVFTCVCVCVCV
jgi:hypothetical protein